MVEMTTPEDEHEFGINRKGSVSRDSNSDEMYGTFEEKKRAGRKTLGSGRGSDGTVGSGIGSDEGQEGVTGTGE